MKSKINSGKLREQVIKKAVSQWQVTMKLKGKRRDEKYNWNKKKTEMIIKNEIKKSRIENETRVILKKN